MVLCVGSRLGVGGHLRGSSDFSCVDLCDQVVKEVASPQVLDGLSLVMEELMFRYSSFALRTKMGGKENKEILVVGRDHKTMRKVP